MNTTRYKRAVAEQLWINRFSQYQSLKGQIRNILLQSELVGFNTVNPQI